MVFLGAGASRVFGFPTSAELNTQFEKFLRSKKIRPLYGLNRHTLLCELEKAKITIRSNGFNYDSDNLFSYLQGYSSPREYMHKAGPYAASMSRTQPITNLNPKETLSTLRNLLEEFVIKQYYSVDPFLKQQISTVFNRLFSRLTGNGSWTRRYVDWRRTKVLVFTTNYDNVIDTFVETLGISWTQGYRTEFGKVVFLPDEFNKSYKLKIFKLNGSITLIKYKDGTIEEEYPPKPIGSIRSRTVVTRVMVYGGDKAVYGEPYFDLLSHLKKSLQRVSICTVIGYSFRDVWIRQIFEDVALKKDPHKFNIHLISRRATQTKNRLGQLAKYIHASDNTLQEYLRLPISE